MRNPKYPNDIGAAWKKDGENGKYVSIALDLEMLMEMTGGAVDTVNLQLYPIISDHPKAPDFSLKYYPPKGQTLGTAPRVTQPPAMKVLDDDDDIPF